MLPPDFSIGCCFLSLCPSTLTLSWFLSGVNPSGTNATKSSAVVWILPLSYLTCSSLPWFLICPVWFSAGSLCTSVQPCCLREPEGNIKSFTFISFHGQSQCASVNHLKKCEREGLKTFYPRKEYKRKTFSGSPEDFRNILRWMLMLPVMFGTNRSCH